MFAPSRIKGLVVGATLVLAACAAGETMTNASLQQTIPDTTAVAPIPASVVVISSSNDDVIDNDLANALRNANAFQAVASARQPGAQGQLRLLVSSESAGVGNVGGGMAEGALKGVASGLTFGVTEWTMKDKEWFEVKIAATLQSGARTLGRYESTARFETAIRDGAPLDDKIRLGNQRIQATYAHALELMVAKIKQDRAQIVAQL